MTVTYATANGTATAGSDYTALPATQADVPAGTPTAPVTVTVIGDTASEPNETFAVNLTAPEAPPSSMRRASAPSPTTTPARSR